MRGEDILNVLLDVEWVVGSFVADLDGQLCFYQMPAEFGEQELRRTTVRLASIMRCAELCELGVEQCALSLNRYQLLTSRFRNGFLCVMVEAPVNRRALDMATRIAVESLPRVLDSIAAAAEPSQDRTAPSLEPELDGAGSEPPLVPLPRPVEACGEARDEPGPDTVLGNGADNDVEHDETAS